MAKPGRPPKNRSRDVEKDGGVHLEPRSHKAPDVRDMPIISYSDAKERGWRWYYTGIRCVRGHLAPRRVAGCACVECQREDARRRKARSQAKKQKDTPPDITEIW